jgi:undecaprenyl-diphosphatase
MAGAPVRPDSSIHNGPSWFARRSVIVTGAVLAAVLLLAWFALAKLVVDRGATPTALDSAVLSFMVGHRYQLLTVLMIGITNAGGTLAMTVVATVATGWLAWRRQWAQAVLVAVAGIGSAILVPLTKNIVGRVRPTGHQLVVQTNQAFPSGHALGSITVIGVVTAVALTMTHARRTRVILVTAATLFVILVGLSRLYLGVHWATDVLGGWLLGGAWLTLCLTAAAFVAHRRADAA